MYTLAFSARFTKSFRKKCRSGRFPLKRFEEALANIQDGKPLPSNFHDHALTGELAWYREFHLDYDLLVQYHRNDTERIVTFSKIGTHSELFGT